MTTIESLLTILAWRFKDKNGFTIADQTSEPITGSFGDFVRLEIDYQTDALGGGEMLQKIQSNFALFIPDGCLYPYVGSSLSVGWQYLVPTVPTLGVNLPMCLLPESISPTQINQQAYIKLTSADEFTISLDFYLTADVNGYISTEVLENVKRLLYSAFSSDDLGVNESTSAYSVQKSIGTYTYVETAGTANRTFYNTTNLNTTPDFVNEGVMNNQTYAYERAGQPVATVSSIQDTTIIFQADHTGGTVSKANLWVIGFDRFTDEKAFYLDGADYVASGTPVNVGGDTYETQYILTAAQVNADESFYFLFVYYDEANDITSSFISPIVQSIDYQDTAALTVADITSSLSNYNTQYGDYIDSVPFQRIRASMSIDKTAYNAAVVQGDFDTNFQGVNIRLKISGEEQEVVYIASDATSSDIRIENVINTGSVLSWDFIFRPSDAWILETLDISYELLFLQGDELTIYEYLQKLDIVETDNDNVSPKILTFMLTDIAGDEVTDVCSDETGTYKTLSTITEDGRNHIIVADTGTLNEDEEYTSPNVNPLTQLDQAGISANDSVYSAFQAESTIDFSQVTDINRLIVVSLPEVPDCGILQENGAFIIQENGGYILQENCL